MHHASKIVCAAVLVIAAGSVGLADSFKIDVSPLGIAFQCANGVRFGINRVCLSVTNDDQDEAAGDHAKPIKSVYFEFAFSADCGWWHPVYGRPAEWDTDSGEHPPILPPLGRGPRQWVHWETDDADACLGPGEASTEPFCITMVGTPEVHFLTTDTEDNDGDGFGDMLSETNLGGQDVSDVNDEDFRTDTDGDGIVDEDETRSDPTVADTDGDGFPDGSDNCPGVDNPDQTDTDGDGIGDACDPDPDKKDADFDNLDDGQETAIGTDPEKIDTDDDEHPDSAELRKGSNPTDPDSVPEVSFDGLDNDGFGLIDEEFDPDGDGFDSLYDNCVQTANASQRDGDGDGEGDACDFDDGLLSFTSADGAELAWQHDVGFLSYNLYRGSLAELRETGIYVQAPGTNPYASWFCDLLEPFFLDDLDPLPGDAYFWLVTGNDADGIEHDLGASSNGDPRPFGPSCHH